MLKALITLCFLAQATIASSTNTFKTTTTYFDLDKKSDPQYDIARVDVTEIQAEPVVFEDYAAKASIKEIAMIVDSLIAIGTKVYKIIEAGKPVTNVNTDLGITVIPFKNKDEIDHTFYSMENWSAPEAKAYRVSYKNGFNSEVIAFTYTVMYQHSGQYEGKGKYLAGINIVASDVSVSWGFDFEASSNLIQLSNHGSKTNQVAGATFKINYVAKSLFREIRSADTFHVMGNGYFRKY